MFANYKKLFITLLIPFSLFADKSYALYWEIPDPRLPYIARIRVHNTGHNAILYNPVFCEKIGKACAFFINHAYGHDVLNHMVLPPEAYPRTLEAEADCWAAKNSKVDEVQAAIDLMLDEDRDPELLITGNISERTKNIQNCLNSSK